MTRGTFEIYVDALTQVEARVCVRYQPGPGDESSADRVGLRGTLRGPFCSRAQTLPAEFAFRDRGTVRLPSAEAIVPDPCLWSPDLPHLYRADVEVVRGDGVVDEYHGEIGLRQTSSSQDEAANP